MKRVAATVLTVAALVVATAVPSVSPVGAQDGLPPYASRITKLTMQQRADMIGVVWRPGCPVALSNLRSVRVRYVTPAGTSADGVVVVHRRVSRAMVRVFERLYDTRFPIAGITPIEEYAGDDDASVIANNTSAFNCRNVEGTDRWSQHAYGTAIDINPMWNPYVRSDGTTKLAECRPFLDRSRTDVPGYITADGPVLAAFIAEGWGWGGFWRTSKDYQHFSQNGR
jgi:hypothetical protein